MCLKYSTAKSWETHTSCSLEWLWRKRKARNNRHWWGCGEIFLEALCTAHGNVKGCKHYGKQSEVSSKQLNIELPHDPAIPLLGTEPKESKAGTWRDISTPVFTAAWLKTAKKCKQLSVHQWIMDRHNVVHSHHVVHPWSSPAMKRTEAVTLATTWTDPENTKLNGWSGHRRTDTQFVIPLIGSLYGKDGTLYGEDMSLWWRWKSLWWRRKPLW